MAVSLCLDRSPSLGPAASQPDVHRWADRSGRGPDEEFSDFLRSRVDHAFRYPKLVEVQREC